MKVPRNFRTGDPSFPVLFVSARHTGDDRVRGRPDGASEADARLAVPTVNMVRVEPIEVSGVLGQPPVVTSVVVSLLQSLSASVGVEPTV